MFCPRSTACTLGPQPLAPRAAAPQQRAAHCRGNPLRTALWRVGRHALAIVAGTAFLVTYANTVALAQPGQAALTAGSTKEANRLITTLRRATVRYHDLAAARQSLRRTL